MLLKLIAVILLINKCNMLVIKLSPIRIIVIILLGPGKKFKIQVTGSSMHEWWRVATGVCWTPWQVNGIKIIMRTNMYIFVPVKSWGFCWKEVQNTSDLFIHAWLRGVAQRLVFDGYRDRLVVIDIKWIMRTNMFVLVKSLDWGFSWEEV